MPTDLVEVVAHRRNARAEANALVSLCLVCLILCLGELILIFASDNFAEAVTQTGLLELGQMSPLIAR